MQWRKCNYYDVGCVRRIMELLGERGQWAGEAGAAAPVWDTYRAWRRYLQLRHTLPRYGGASIPSSQHSACRGGIGSRERVRSGALLGAGGRLEATGVRSGRRAAPHRPAQPRSAHSLPAPSPRPPRACRYKVQASPLMLSFRAMHYVINLAGHSATGTQIEIKSRPSLLTVTNTY